jgi:pyroglutamyl-peptidase
MKILLSGFMPFNHHKENPSQILVESLSVEKSNKHVIEGIILPVTFKNAFPVLKEKIIQSNPDYVICFGLAENRNDISLENIAVNINNAKIPDNDNERPINQLILTDGDSELYTTLPIERWLALSSKHNYPVSISQSAGTYVCNNVMYQTISLGNEMGFKSGFIHISNDLEPLLIKKTIESFLEVI